MHYIAYGSNMSIEQMNLRCPGAKMLGVGEVKGMRLLFRGHPYSAVATIEKARHNSSVPVVLWDITEEDELELDRYEGFPRLYTKVELPVSTEDGEVIGMAYVIDPNLRFGTPSSYYYGVLRDAYINFGFDLKKLRNAVIASAGDWKKLKKGSLKNEAFD